MRLTGLEYDYLDRPVGFSYLQFTPLVKEAHFKKQLTLWQNWLPSMAAKRGFGESPSTQVVAALVSEKEQLVSEKA